MAKKIAAKKKAPKKVRRVVKMKPAIVPVAVMPHSEWLLHMALRDYPNSAFDRPKKPQKKKWRIFQPILMFEFSGTDEDAQKELDELCVKFPKSRLYLEEVLPATSNGNG